MRDRIRQTFCTLVASVIAPAISPPFALALGAEASASPPDSAAPDGGPEPAAGNQWPSGWGVLVSARAGGFQLGSDHFGFQLSAAAAISAPLPLAPALRLEAGYTFPLQLNGQGYTGELTVMPARAYLSIDPLRRTSWRVWTALGGGFDTMLIATRSLAPTLSAVAQAPRLDPVFSAAVGARFKLSESIGLIAQIALDIDTQRTAWFVSYPDTGNATVVEAARLRPSFALGIDGSWQSRGPSQPSAAAGAERP